ncbi:1-phosphofructokinase family hexose kinase [Methylomicrobium sp. Wu6]|uniref:1-phosphofructokinase family hexose kinase n=1 Tax=Methylomicrobium sp. Wu6 TaxID=3107928 RepID=UPI002DD6583A|nr:1-phosphofructokinase family hexose kinase [Methylomicrobium sp. Wu6]MEC4748898.1 1-phosphofructokinase family hexose kinase [Methylomicrobium sp. Wu6]
MSKIITVTANTAVDWLIEANGLGYQDNLQATKSCEYACGKGINVAKAVESLGYPVTCLGFAGRQSIGLFEALNSALLHADLIAVEGKTRTNITLTDQAAGRETHIRTSGYRVTPDDCAKLIEKVERSVNAGDIVIFSGSLPPGAPNDFYRMLIATCRRKAAITLLDSSGQGLAEGAKAEPYLIKPNMQELEELTGRALTNDREVLETARALLGQGIAKICISLGNKGVIAVDEDSAFAACLRHCPEPIMTQIGCGDALVAGLAIGTHRGLRWEDCIKWAIACATANLYSPEPGRLDKDKVPEISTQIETFPR